MAVKSADTGFARNRISRRAIQSRVENPVAKLILQGKFGPKDIVPVSVVDGEFSFERVVH